MILGTAGHVDHGKTMLVRALTGVDTDRLPEEKRRGITIDLGFAPLDLEGVGRIGVVDVPGHESFVRTMVAGASGIDMVLLVIAADSGVMAQTTEHLAIISLLGITRGVVAITKSDLVDEEWLDLVVDDVRATLGRSSLADAEIIPVSSTTGSGIDRLRAALGGLAVSAAPRSTDDLFRLPVDRAFSVKGTGTVVTGTVWSGSVGAEAQLRSFPGDRVVRVRGVHAHGRSVDRVHAGDRAALAISTLDVEDVRRGATLVQGEGWCESRLLRCELELLEDAAPPGPRTRLRLHLGTNDVGARIVARSDMAVGGVLPARLVVDEPLVARAGDRFVLRASSPASTIGGGVITDPCAPRRARPWPAGTCRPSSILAALLAESGSAGISVSELPVRLGAAPREIEPLVAAADAWRVGTRSYSTATRRELERTAIQLVGEHHRLHPLDSGLSLQVLRAQLSITDELVSALATSLSNDKRIVATHGSIALAGFASVLSAKQESLRVALVDVLRRSGIEPPDVDELVGLVSSTRADVLDVLWWLARRGSVVAVEPARYYPAETLRSLVERLRGGMSEDREYTASELREVLGFTRKFTIPFLEYCDGEGYTIRNGSGRRLSRQRT